MANILTTAIVAHILDPRDFGIFTVALTAYAIVSSVGELGVSLCLIRADLNIDAIAPTMVTVSLTTSAVLAAAMAFFAEPIAAALGSAKGANAVKVMAVTVVLVGIFAVPTAQLGREFRQDRLFLSNIVSFVPSAAVLIVLAKTGNGAMAFAWSRVVGQFVAGCVITTSVPKHYWPGIARKALRLLFTFGVPLASANFINYILLNVDYALVGHLLGAAVLGIYVLAFNAASWPASLCGNVINSVSMPAFSRVKHDPDLVKNAVAGSLRILALVVLPMSAITAALARPLVLTLYGHKWLASANVLIILALYGAISVFCLLFANILSGLGRTKFILAVQIVWLAALVPMMSLGVRRNGVVGAAVAHIAVIAPIVLPSYVVALRKATGIRVGALVRAVVPVLLVAGVSALAARAVAMRFDEPVAQLSSGLAVGFAAYLLTAGPFALALLSKEQITRLRLQAIAQFYESARQSLGLRPKRQTTASAQAIGQLMPVTGGGYATPRVRQSGSRWADAAPPSARMEAAALSLLMSLSSPAERRTSSSSASWTQVLAGDMGDMGDYTGPMSAVFAEQMDPANGR